MMKLTLKVLTYIILNLSQRCLEEDAVGWISLYFGVPERAEVERIFNLLVNRQFIHESPQGYTIEQADVPEPLLPKRQLYLDSHDFMTLHPLEIARQLTLLHSHLFHSITAIDMIRQLQKHKVINIEAEVNFSNRVRV